jgi:hypothetical protein
MEEVKLQRRSKQQDQTDISINLWLVVAWLVMSITFIKKICMRQYQ